MSSSMVYASNAQRHRPAESRPSRQAFTTASPVRAAGGGLQSDTVNRRTARHCVAGCPSCTNIGHVRLYGLCGHRWERVLPAVHGRPAGTPRRAGRASGYGSGRRGERCAWTMSSALRLIYRGGGEYVRSAASVARRRPRPVGARPALRAARFPRTRTGVGAAWLGRHRLGRQGRDSASHRNDLRGA
jgi:hypothetical protein